MVKLVAFCHRLDLLLYPDSESETTIGQTLHLFGF